MPDQLTVNAVVEYRHERVDDLQRAYTTALVAAQTLRTPEAWIAVGQAFDHFIELALLADERPKQ